MKISSFDVFLTLFLRNAKTKTNTNIVILSPVFDDHGVSLLISKLDAMVFFAGNLLIVIYSSGVIGSAECFFKTTYRFPTQVLDEAQSAVLCRMLINSCHKSSPPQPLTDLYFQTRRSAHRNVLS